MEIAAKPSRLEEYVEDLVTKPVDCMAFEAIFDEAIATKAECLPPAFRDAVAQIGDETLGYVFAEACETIEHMVAPIEWTKSVVKAELERRMTERRKDSTGTIEIPHPEIEISSTPDWEPYSYDIDQLQEAFRGLPDDEVQKLLKTEPAREYSNFGLSDAQCAAIKVAIELVQMRQWEWVDPSVANTLRELLATTTVPETVTVRNASSLQAWLKKNAGSTRAKIAASAITRNMRGTKVVIRPKNLPKRVEPALAPVAIEGAK